jgi:hypothetical protein
MHTRRQKCTRAHTHTHTYIYIYIFVHIHREIQILILYLQYIIPGIMSIQIYPTNYVHFSNTSHTPMMLKKYKQTLAALHEFFIAEFKTNVQSDHFQSNTYLSMALNCHTCSWWIGHGDPRLCPPDHRMSTSYIYICGGTWKSSHAPKMYNSNKMIQAIHFIHRHARICMRLKSFWTFIANAAKKI